MSTDPPVVLAVAGTDSGGAAGLAADLATIAAHRAHGACVVTAITAQDTTGVHAVHVPPLDMIDEQIAAVLDDLTVASVKTGMLGSPEVVRLVAERLGHLRLVVDPVLIATSGAVLGDESVRAAYVDHLLPIATVVTPNVEEAAALLGVDGACGFPPEELAARLAAQCGGAGSAGGPAVVVTGGGTTGTCTDWLALLGQTPVALSHPALATENDHGTGCTYSAALASLLAQGIELETACRCAAAYTSQQLALSRRWELGRGRGPIAHVAASHPSH